MGAETKPQKGAPARTFTNDPRYGGLVYLSPHTGTVYQCVQLEEKSMCVLIELINKRKALRHGHLLTVKNHFFRHEKGSAFACHSDNKIEMYLEFPYLKQSLEDLLEERSTKGLPLSEQEVRNIFKAVVEALSFLAKNGTCHGDIKASSILFDHCGVPKLIDSYFVNGGKTAYEIVLENPSSMSLLAPEQMERIKHRQCEDLSTIHASEMFMVGLTMLQAMTFENAMQSYNLETLALVEGYQQRKIKELAESSYSRRLCQLVISCIAEQISERPSFEEFLSCLGS